MDLIKKIKKFLSQTEKPPIIVILGPTASGKTALSLKIAKAIDGEVISTDSRQLYRQMEIGTDAITEEEQEGVPHHLLGITDPDQTITLAQYHDLATQIIEGIHLRKHIPILVGGTGLYISALIENYQMDRIEPDSGLRAELEKEAQEKGVEHLYNKLKKLDQTAAKKIHPNNIRYVIRALEINLAGKKKKADKKGEPPYDTFLVGINWPREQLYQRVNLRVDRQIERGLVQEVQALMDHGYCEALPSMSSLGVKEIIPYIKGEMTLDECLEILKRNTRRYAKRQMTWFRRYDNVLWLKPEEL